MPEDTNCERLLQPSRSSDSTNKKKKKKRRRKATASTTPPQHTVKLQAVSLPPETLPVSLLPPQSPGQPRGQLPKLRATTEKDGERLSVSGRRSRDSPGLLTVTTKSSGALEQGYLSELSAQARESLRWEGVLEDPQAEEKRLEMYRSNRRQRYITHREALAQETQDALHRILRSNEKKEAASLQHLSTD